MIVHRSANDKLAVDSLVLLVWGWVVFQSKREKECLSNQRSVNSCLANSPSVFIYRRWWGRGGRVRKRWRETPATKAAFLLHFASYFNFPAVNSSPIRIRSALFRMTDFTREYRLKHEKIFATECRRLKQKFVKGDGNPMQTLKKTRNFRFCGVNFISVEGRVSFENFSAVGQSWKCEADFGSLLRLCWVAIINQIKKRKLVKTGLQNQKRIWTVQFHWEITLRGWERSKQKTASHHYHARRKRCKKETSRIWRWTAERKKSWKG